MNDDDAIAIVGIGGKFPGADNIKEFWKILVNGENHVVDIPPERWNVEAFFDGDPDAPGKTYVRKAGLLKHYDEFDNKMFGISDIEAQRMDPQQRYVLECVHMALEDGGIPSSVIQGTDTGVFIGVMNDDYKGISADDLSTMTNYSLTGTSQSIIPARVSYTYNLLGPSMAIDTACSSALVAIDTGIQNIITGRCPMVICGGVNSLVSPDLFIPLSRARMISPTGQCQAFSAKADGYCRGEGCGIVILKKLGEAKKDKNKIWATIATHCNQDGHTATPITAPSSKQQEKLLEQIYSKNMIDPASIQVIEAHGTGTPVGDPIEINTLGRFFTNDTSDVTRSESKIYVASVKTNIGHLESAAGVAGLIKVLLMMKNKTIVPSLHFTPPNTKIEFEKFQLEVPVKSKPWNNPSRISRIACTNCFGFGGTNAHAIIKDYTDEDIVEFKCSKFGHLVFFSSHHESELANTLQTFIDDISQNKYKLCDVSYTSMCRRDHLSSRVAVLADNMDDLIPKLRQRKQQELSHHLAEVKPPRVIAVFCGVGTLWKGMCKDLLTKNDIFRNTVYNVDEKLNQIAPISIYDVLIRGEDITDPFTGHIAIFTCQIALWVLWKSYGLYIDAILGQSVGEVAAAYASGCLTLDQAIEVIYLRSKHLAGVTGGQMFAIGNCKTKHIEDICSHYKGKACIAVYSSSKSCVIACDADIVDELIHSIRTTLLPDERDNLFLKNLKVKCAYHSHHTEQAGAALEQDLHKLHVIAPKIEVISSVTGSKADAETFNSKYWNRNVCKPVQFKSTVMEAGHSDKFNIFIEIGPKPVLRPLLSDSFSSHDAVCLSSMEFQNESSILVSAGKMFEYKVKLDWSKISCMGKICEVPKIPLHPTLKGIYMSDVSLLKGQGLGTDKGSHLFISRTHSKTAMFKLNISEKNTPFVYHHFVSNSIVVPGAFYAELALEVGHTVTNRRIQDICVKVDFLHLLQLSSKRTYSVDVTLTNSSKNSVSGLVKRGNEAIASFEASIAKEGLWSEGVSIATLKRECRSTQSSDTTYEVLKKMGFSYGTDLKVLGNAIKNETQCLVEMHLSDAIWNDVKTTNIHPSVLDGLLQTPGVLPLVSDNNITSLPAGIDRLIVRKGVERDMFAYAEIAYKSQHYTSYNMALLSHGGSVIVEVKGFKIKHVSESLINQSKEYVLKWKEVRYLRASGHDRNNVLLFSFNKETLTNIAEVLSNAYKVMPVLIEDKSLNDHKMMVQNMFDRKECLQIVFMPGIWMRDSMQGEEMFKPLKASCKFMLALVQMIQKAENYVPITVITECTQTYDVNKCKNINLCGSELWGQVRSIVREDPLLDIILLDCRPSVHTSNNFISKLIKERPSGVGELICENDKVYSSYLARHEQDDKNFVYKNVSLNEKCKVKLKAKKQNDTSKTFLVLESPLQTLTDQYASFSLQDVFIHSPNLHETTIQSCSQKGFSLYENEEIGVDVLAFEATAMENIAEKVNIEKHMPKGCGSAEKVILFPMRVQSTVSVPRDSVYSLDDLKGYTPGILLKATLMYTLSCHVRHENPLVIYDKENQILAKLLQYFLANIHDCQASIDSVLKPTPYVIIMKVLSNHDVEELITSGSLISVCSLSIYLTPSQRVMLQMNGISVNCLQTDTVFDQTTLLSMSPIIHKYLYGRLQQLMESFLIDDFYLKRIHGESISLRPDDLKLYKSVRLPKHKLLRKDCCYIVVGGLTGLGWQILKLLAENGAGEVISISRRHPDSSKQGEMKEIGKMFGCRVRSLSADVADLNSTKEVFAKIEKSTSLQVSGIFQGAGILRNVLSLHMTEKELFEVMTPKVLGTWNLHLISRHYRLDYFVMHSSVTSVLGNIGQSNYGAANSFLDSLAYFRRIHNLNSQSINWGPLALGMMREGPHTEKLDILLKEKGYIFLEIDQIRQCLMSVMLNDQVQIMIGSFDWNVISRNLTREMNSKYRYKFRKFLNDNDRLLHDSNQSSQDEMFSIFNSTSEVMKGKIMDVVLKVVNEAFIHDVEPIDTWTPFAELGIDSMQVMTFSNKIYEIFGIRIPLIKWISEEATFDTIVNLLYNELKENRQQTFKQESSVSKELSPILRPLYDAYLRHPDDPNLTIFVDLELSQTVGNPSLWENLLKWLQFKYTTLRTLIKANEDKSEVTTIVLDPDNTQLDFKVVKINELDLEQKYPSDKKQLLFEPSKDCPIRALFANDSEKCILRLIFNHILLDFTSIGTLVNDLRYMYISKKAPQKEDIVNIDMYHVFQTRLTDERSKLMSYWQNRTPKVQQSMSLTGVAAQNLNPNSIEKSNVLISKPVVEQLRNVMKEHKIKLSELAATFYHVLLWQRLQSDIVAIFMTVDLRVHFPELKGFVGCFGNVVPMYAEMNPAMSLLSLIKTNKESLSDGLVHSILPFSDIVEIIKNKTSLVIDQHKLTMEYLRDLDESLNRLKNIKIKRIATIRHNVETNLYVWYNLERNHLKFELAYNCTVIDKSIAVTMLNMIRKMITAFIGKPTIILGDVIALLSEKDQDELLTPNKKIAVTKTLHERTQGGFSQSGVQYVVEESPTENMADQENNNISAE